jgi:hypothetical protein
MSKFTPRVVRFSVAATCAAGLSACVVLPIDPATGRPYPVVAEPATRTTVVMPPAPSAPPQASVISARLYPLNPIANKGGLLTAVVVDQHTGRGSFTLAYQGDNLQGEATRVDNSYAGFGRIHQEVLGTAARAPTGQRGIANAYGSKGVNAQCEYLMTSTSQGTGVCLLSDGAKYQMHFGS